MKIPTKKEAEKLIKLAEKEIIEYQNFIEDLKLFTRKKKINIKICPTKNQKE